ncbi:lipid A deacylase LpxR family protein [Pedobacter sp. MC2016-14]|uniref:lipid A deacylase LpxR family protein n=1 Tax=Pedobacter sp. MC2016-14 TaxID=2897327 RepID=UPI001E309AAB|nr:lipid A deacylase LpxR family protein [Pedobacter sp. MC2016-14]MCD0489059.1 lipid A deacylase LpxR family protein [Pedobacter sp. MC2016-14]
MTANRFLPLFIFLFLSALVQAQTYKNEFGFKSDNDSYLGQGSDRYYTNGLFINFRHALDQQQLKAGLEKKVYEISVGQKMYNAYSGYAPDPALQDRPFAGYLYAGAALSWFTTNESILKVSAELGTTGPNSLAEDGQEILHKTVGFYTLDGWQYQIKNELAVNLSAQYTKLLSRVAEDAVDFSFESYANLGTTFNGAGAGILFRAGALNQLFNSAYTNSVIGNNAKTKALIKREFFFYAKPQLNFVAYDATVQGSLFNNDSPVTFGTKPIVFAQQLGVNYSSQRFTVDYSMLFKTKEIKSTARAHQWGAITMYYRFN